MMSLEELKRKLELAKSKVKNEEPHEHFNNNTAEITDGSMWLAKINENGNQPCDWLGYTRFVKRNKVFSDALKRHNVLCGLYDKAFKAVDIDDNKRDLSLALLFIDYADIKSAYRFDEAQLLLTHARAKVRKFAIVHIAAAELEMKLGDRKKAGKILKKAQMFEVEPEQLIEEALNKLEAGEDILISPHVRDKCMGYLSEEITLPICSTALPTEDTTRNIVNFKNATEIEMNESHTAPLSNDVFQSTRELSVSTERKDMNPRLRKFHSSPVLSLQKPESLASRWRRNGAAAGLPMRIKRMNLPFDKPSETEEDQDHAHEEDTMASFKPLNNSFASNDASESHESTSGYLSMSQINGSSTPFQKADNVFKQPTLDRSRDHAEMETNSLGDVAKVKLKEFSLSDPIVSDQIVLDPIVEGQKLGHVSNDAVDTKESNKCDISNILPSSFHLDFKSENNTLENVNSVCSNDARNGKPSCHINVPNSPHIQKSEVPLVIQEHKLANGYVAGGTNDKQKSIPEPPVCDLGSINSTMEKSSRPCPSDVHQKEVKNSDFPLLKPNVSAVPHSLNVEHAMCTPSMKMNPALFAQMQYGSHCTPNMIPENIITINGQNYRKLKAIGRGGTCTVHRVLDHSNNLRAVKIVELDDADEAMIDGYRNEISLLQRLQYCDKVIKMYDYEFSETDNCLYVVMEIGETDLATLFKNNMKKGAKLDELTIKFYWCKMLEAVSALHQEGIVHTDLKPANFLLVSGNLKLIDFGIAKAIQHDRTSVTRDAQIGTLNYMSPEAIIDVHGGSGVDDYGRTQRKYKLGTKSDTWSLGCILFNMVHGRTPFQNIRYQMDKLQAITNPNYPINFPDHNDKNLCDVLQKCLIRDPKQRPSIDALLAHPYLKAIKEDSPEAVRPPSVPKSSDVSQEHLEKFFAQHFPQFSPRTLESTSKEFIKKLVKDKENIPVCNF